MATGRRGHPHPRIKYEAGSSPFPSRERGAFDKLRMRGALRQAQDERGRGVPPSPPYQVRARLLPSPIEGEGPFDKGKDERGLTLALVRRGGDNWRKYNQTRRIRHDDEP